MNKKNAIGRPRLKNFCPQRFQDPSSADRMKARQMFDAALKRAGSLASKQFLGVEMHEDAVHLSRIV